MVREVRDKNANGCMRVVRHYCGTTELGSQCPGTGCNRQGKRTSANPFPRHSLLNDWRWHCAGYRSHHGSAALECIQVAQDLLHVLVALIEVALQALRDDV